MLASVARQSAAPREIIIADDGSRAATLEVIDSFVRAHPAAVRVVRQAHEGFRVARLRNLAIAAARCDYLVFIDGDMLLHREFMADHARFARRGHFTQGIRAHADAPLTTKLIEGSAKFPTASTPGLGGLRRAYLLHSAPLSGLMRHAANSLVALKACNLGVWRADLLRINGFDEDMVGWGPEDKELCARLTHAGVRRQTLLFGGIACHLHHPPESRTALDANLAILAATRASRRVRASHGLDGHLRD